MSEPWQRAALTHLSAGQGPYDVDVTMADAWERPSPMALTSAEVEQIQAFAVSVGPNEDGPGAPTAFPGVTSYTLGLVGNRQRWAASTVYAPAAPVPDRIAAPLIARLVAANERWWGLALDCWSFIVKRYVPGGEHPLHQDWQPTGSITKLASSFQLSGSDDYAGGDFVMPMGPGKANVLMPRSEGAAVIFPCWTVHGIRPVSSGERWVLLVNGWGPRLR